jgi:hypothetical protein
MIAETAIQSSVTKPILNKKAPKRAVSFAKVCQYHTTTTTDGCDDVLQCRDKRRRYQRRGSKTPAMLRLSRSEIRRIQENFSTNEHITHVDESKRRMSMISSLRQNLELNCLLEPVMGKTLRRMSLDPSGAVQSSCTLSWALK